MDFEPEKCAHPTPLGGHRVRAGKCLPLTGAKNNNNNNNGKKIIEKLKLGVQHEDFPGGHSS